MISGSYKVNFKDLKQRVGIDDVAYLLGYRLDKKAGVGKYAELVLGQGDGKRDTIIVANIRDKAAQTYFRRDGSKGDVISFIHENLNAFVSEGTNEWQKIGSVLARLANMPSPDFCDKTYMANARIADCFDSARYETAPIKDNVLPFIIKSRGFTLSTIQDLKDNIVFIKDKTNNRFNGYNIGFPYKKSLDGAIEGYEIRGTNGFKSKAAGTNSNSAAWMVDLDRKGAAVANVFFFESAFDAMAFYQVNKPILVNSNAALVSIGGTFSENQIRSVIEQFPEARLHDCFDNDLAGNLYGIRLAAIAENKNLSVSKNDNTYHFSVNGKAFSIPSEKLSLSEFYKNVPGRFVVSARKAPDGFKDWNDFILDKRMTPLTTATKVDRDVNLYNRRSGLKL